LYINRAAATLRLATTSLACDRPDRPKIGYHALCPAGAARNKSFARYRAVMGNRERSELAESRRQKNAPAAKAAKQDYPASESIGLLMRIALFGLRASFKAQLAKHGVPWSAWYYLRVLWETDAITQRELTERVGVMQPNTVSALQTMRRAGWVTITKSDKDRRQILVTLTPKGRKLMQRLLPEIRAAVRPALLDNFSAQDEKELRRLLNKICDNVRRNALL
jgi:DNA-binding MarR family transcriptional regulator